MDLIKKLFKRRSGQNLTQIDTVFPFNNPNDIFVERMLEPARMWTGLIGGVDGPIFAKPLDALIRTSRIFFKTLDQIPYSVG